MKELGEADADGSRDQGLHRSELEVLNTPPEPKLATADLPELPPQGVRKRERSAAPPLFTSEDLRYAAGFVAGPYTDVLRQRRSVTSGLRPPHRRDLATLLYHSARVLDFGQTVDGYPGTRRPYPSAGATHAIDLLVHIEDCVGADCGMYLFTPTSCQLLPLTVPTATKVELSRATQLASRQPKSPPVAIYLMADVPRLTAKYDHALSLLLRDAGACAATVHLTATSVGLGSSILGLLGPQVAQPHRPSSSWACCGAVVVGAASQ